MMNTRGPLATVHLGIPAQMADDPGVRFLRG